MNESQPKPFFRFGKIFLLVLLALVVYLSALVVWVPAGWLWSQFSSNVQLPDQVQVRQVSGRIWEGAAGLDVAGYPLRVSWILGVPSLTNLTLPVDISIASSQSLLEGDVTIGWPASAELDARGRVAVGEFEDLIRQSGGAMIEGDVTIDSLNVLWSDNRLQRADGIGRWPGGRVTWPMGNQTGQAQFPPMQADLDTTQGGIGLTVKEQDGNGPAAEANVLWNGMMEVRVYKRMVDLAGQPWSDSASPDDVIFRVRQPLIPGAR
ncbi:type II secretion system protein N [Marinobacter salinisoli]|uniref:Type II secretion system protein N n=1 Tax=Marinobacter salinisoli TaxID=2769486 RepID=A0ABX7MQ57_9GAMM|nr:type II secretion system protein N [Marinobacter salinisoli]QSP94441.1 type II secretion system protein N [Marinobacter salinisoli]